MFQLNSTITIEKAQHPK